MGNGQQIIYEYTKDFKGANVLWLDAKVNDSENKGYQEILKDIDQINIIPFDEINRCIEEIKKIRYVKTFIITSGSILNDFQKELKKIIKEIEILPEIFIFTSFRKFLLVKQNIYNYNFPLLNPNSVFSYFDPIKKRLSEKKLYDPKNKEPIEFQIDKTFTFEYIEELNQLTLPAYISDKIEYPTKKDILNFNKFLLDKFSKAEEFGLLIQQLILNITIPFEILIKYYLRAYTLQSDFYKEMNYCLERKKGKDYETYIKVLYHSLHLEYIKPAEEKKLFRGSVIKKEELEYIKEAFKNKKKNLPACICYNKSFLSSSYEEKVALGFLIQKKKKENEEYVLYELEKRTELDKQNATNSNI